MLEKVLETVIEVERNDKWQEAHVSSYHAHIYVAKFPSFHFSAGKSGIRGCLISQSKGCFFKKFLLALIYRITVTRPSKFLVANGKHGIGKCILRQSKGCGPKNFPGVSPQSPI